MKNLTPLKAIHAYCLACSADQPSEVRYCPITDCPLFIFRFGHNPARKGIGPRITPLSPKSAVESCNPTNTEVLNG